MNGHGRKGHRHDRLRCPCEDCAEWRESVLNKPNNWTLPDYRPSKGDDAWEE